MILLFLNSTLQHVSDTTAPPNTTSASPIYNTSHTGEISNVTSLRSTTISHPKTPDVSKTTFSSGRPTSTLSSSSSTSKLSSSSTLFPTSTTSTRVTSVSGSSQQMVSTEASTRKAGSWNKKFHVEIKHESKKLSSTKSVNNFTRI